MAFKAGDEIVRSAWPASVTVSEATDFPNLTNTTFQPGSPVCATTFTAADSGRAGVAVAANMRESANNTRVFVSFEVYEGTSASGTLLWPALAIYGVSTTGFTGEVMGVGNFTVVDGLTPGATHYIRTMHMVEAGTASDIFDRRLVVIPLP